MKKINVGVIGLGRIGKIHAKNVSEHKDLNLKWVFDPFEKALKSFEKIAENITGNVNDIFDDKTTEAVVICSPTNTHIDFMLKAIKAGKKVLCEKPVDLSLQRANKCLKTVGAKAKNIMIGFNRRFDPSFFEVKNRLKEIGKLEQVIITSRDPAPPPVEYIKVSGGIFKDMTIHDFDMARYIAGDIVKVQAFGQNVLGDAFRKTGDFDANMVVMRSSSDVLVSIVNNRRCDYGYDQRIEVHGSKGMLSVNNQNQTSVKSYSKNTVESKNRYMDFFLERYEKAYILELDQFVKSLKNNTAMSPSLKDGIEALKLAELATKSAGVKL